MPVLDKPELSICLRADDQLATAITSLRSTMPASVYPDYVVHLTLLRGITAPALYTDEVLMSQFSELLTAYPLPNGDYTIMDAANVQSSLYGATSVLHVRPPDTVIDYRRQLVARLNMMGYQVEAAEQTQYQPHITIRLGVSLSGDQLRQAERFVGQTVRCTRPYLYRVYYESGRRLLRPLTLS